MASPCSLLVGRRTDVPSELSVDGALGDVQEVSSVAVVDKQ
jgi:hypothetical protein